MARLEDDLSKSRVRLINQELHKLLPHLPIESIKGFHNKKNEYKRILAEVKEGHASNPANTTAEESNTEVLTGSDNTW